VGTGRAVRELVERRSGKRLGLSTMRLYLQRWGMTPQKPLARARERSPAAVAAWLERDYPAIAKRAKAERAAIYWGDETGISSQDQAGRSCAPRGETPVVVRAAKRITQSMISAVSSRGLMRFMLYDGALNADRSIDFLRRLIKGAGRKVVLPDRRQPEGPQGRQGPGLGREPRARDRALPPAGLRPRARSGRVPRPSTTP
jgi:Winged helix-turn helix/DDE superfamily endonuclease